MSRPYYEPGVARTRREGMSPSRATPSYRIRAPRRRRRERDLANWKMDSRMAVLFAIGAGCMMATAVEIYQADLLPDGKTVPPWTHTQAFFAACAGFLPAFLCLQRLNSGSWSRAIRHTAPWTVLLFDVVMAFAARLQWYWAVGIALVLGVIAYQTMLRIAQTSRGK